MGSRGIITRFTRRSKKEEMLTISQEKKRRIGVDSRLRRWNIKKNS